MADSLFDIARFRIKEALAEHPQITLNEADQSISVEAKDESGYDVRLQDDGQVATIYAGPYHEHFEDPDSAAACFIWMLTPAYRVVEVRKGKHIVGADLERIVGGKVEQMGRFRILFPLFGKKEARVLQNSHLPVPDGDRGDG